MVLPNFEENLKKKKKKKKKKRNEAQLRENIDSYQIDLTQDEHDRIEATARPEPFYPTWHRTMTAFEKASPSEMAYLETYRKEMGLE